MDFKIVLPYEVKYVLEKLNSAGYEAFAVGGCVRDSIMGNTPNDWDICTSAKPDKTAEIFASHRLIEIGIKHGTVGVIVDKKLLEITTYRIDGDYLDSRHPEDVLFTDLLEEDLKRRDFTVNAMAYNPSIGIVDCFCGVKDIENKILRCVGEPDKRLSEDALRILRAIRFSSKLGFAIESNTRTAMFDLKNLLNKIAAERIRCELDGILNGKDANKVLDEYAEIIRVFIPDFQTESLPTLYGDLSIRRALFFTSVGNIEKNMSYLRYSNADIAEVSAVYSNKNTRLKSDTVLIKRLLRKIGKKKLLLLFKIQFPDGNVEIERLIEKCSKECYRITDLAIDGNNLIEMGFVGKDIKTELERLLELVITEKIQNKKECLLNQIERQEV